MSDAGVPASDAPARNDPLVPLNAVGTEPVFREPWEAQAFAMTVLLHERGLFTWSEWAQALGAQIASGAGGRAFDATEPLAGVRAGARDATAEKSYYQHWLAALESLVTAKGASSADELMRYQHGWERAANRTPHGQSIDLQSQDLRD